MKPRPDTLETRRQDVLRAIREPLKPGKYHPGVYVNRERILSLGENPTVEQIMAVNALPEVHGCGPCLMPTIICHGCGREVENVVTVGEEPDWESATCTLCAACLREALDALEEATHGRP